MWNVLRAHRLCWRMVVKLGSRGACKYQRLLNINNNRSGSSSQKKLKIKRKTKKWHLWQWRSRRRLFRRRSFVICHLRIYVMCVWYLWPLAVRVLFVYQVVGSQPECEPRVNIKFVWTVSETWTTGGEKKKLIWKIEATHTRGMQSLTDAQ